MSKKWSIEEKMSIVMEMLKKDKPVTQICKEYGVKDGMAYNHLPPEEFYLTQKNIAFGVSLLAFIVIKLILDHMVFVEKNEGRQNPVGLYRVT